MSEAAPGDRQAEHEALLKRMGNGRRLEWDEEGGRSAAEFTADPDQCHSGGIVQGGFVTGWLDNAMATAAIAWAKGEQGMTTLEVKVAFYRPARAGVPYRAEGWVERAGRKVMFLEGRLTDPDGTLIAKATSTGQWLPRMPGPAEPQQSDGEGE